MLKVLRETAIPIERRSDSAVGGGWCGLSVIAEDQVRADATLRGCSGSGVEDAVTAAHDGLGCDLKSEAGARSEFFEVGICHLVPARATVTISSKGQCARSVASAGVGERGIEQRQAVGDLVHRDRNFVSQTEIKGEPPRGLIIVLHEQSVIWRAIAKGCRSEEARGTVHGTQQETGRRVTRQRRIWTVGQRRFASSKSKRSVFAMPDIAIILILAQISADSECVFTFHPAQRIVEHHRLLALHGMRFATEAHTIIDSTAEVDEWERGVDIADARDA